MTRPVLQLATLAALMVLAACGERAQVAATGKTDGKPWDGAQNGFVVGGWKPGDKTEWEAQMRARAQNQNEYTRAPAKP